MKTDVLGQSPHLATKRHRRSWSADAKRKIVAESLAAGASMAEVARRHEVNPNLLFTWRRQAAKNAVVDHPGPVGFVPVAIAPETPSAAGRMEIIVEGARIVVGADVDAAALARVVRALSARPPPMIPMPMGVRVWLATGHTDMRKGFDGLALIVQETLKRDPHGGHLVRFSRTPRRPDQMPVARRPGDVSVLEASGARTFSVAFDGGRRRDDLDRATGLSAFGH